MGSREEKMVYGNPATLLNFSMPYHEKVQRWSGYGGAQLFHPLSKKAQSSDRAPIYLATQNRAVLPLALHSRDSRDSRDSRQQTTAFLLCLLVL